MFKTELTFFYLTYRFSLFAILIFLDIPYSTNHMPMPYMSPHSILELISDNKTYFLTIYI